MNSKQPVAKEFVAFAERISAALGRPRVRALHLPAAGTAGKEGEFCALELDEGSVGFSYILLADTESRLRAADSGAFGGVPAISLARRFEEPDLAARTLAFAAISALSQALFRRAGWSPPLAGDSAGQVVAAPGKVIGMIGLFARLASQIVATGAELIVLELKAELAGPREGYRVTLNPAELAGCEQVISTSTILLNDTLDDVLAACRQARYFAIVGPTAGCVPDPLFARGVAAVGGARVSDRQAFLAAFNAGAPWSAHASKYVITREAYPGAEALLARISS